MTNVQKEQIRKLREQGKSYGEISSALGVSKNTIKSYCNRHPIEERKSPKREKNAPSKAVNTTMIAKAPLTESVHRIPTPVSGQCRCCGAPLIQTIGRRKRFFCSEECRRRWWTRHPEAAKDGASHPLICPSCGNPFTVYGNRKRKYCSHQCYIKARFKKGQ